MTRWFQAHWSARVLISLVGVVALSAVATPTLLAPRNSLPIITLPPIQPLDAGLRWTGSAASPNAIQQMAVDQLLGWLVALGWGALVVGAITALALWATLAAQRVAEVGVRRAVGASRRAILGAALGEGASIWVLTVTGGLGLAALATSGAVAGWPGPSTPMKVAFPAGPLIVLAVAMGLGSLFPLWAARSRRVVEQSENPPPLWIPAIQLGASLAALVGAALIIGPTGAKVAQGELPRASGTVDQLEHQGATAEARAASYQALLRSIRQTDSNVVASLTSPGGHDGMGTVDQLTTDCGQCYVGGIYLKWRPLRANYHTASADTFRARGVRVIEGRAFTDQDRAGSAPVAIVNQYLAARYFESGQPLGREVFLAGRMIGTAYRVIGVVDDRATQGIGAELRPLETIYLSTLQVPGKHTELWRVGSGSTPLEPPNGVVVISRTSRAAVARQREAALRWFGRWFGLEGGATMLLALGGIVVLMGSWVSASRSEFAIRRAVGAGRWQIRRFVLGRAVAAAGAGIGLGLVFFGPVVWPEIARLIPGVSYWRPGLVTGVAAGLTTVTLLAGLGPAWRAARSSPAELTSHR